MVLAVGVTTQVPPIVPRQVPPVQLKAVAAGMQLAVKVALRPAVMADGETRSSHTGVVAEVTVTMATDPNNWLPARAVTVYSVVAEGDTVQVALAVPAQEPPVQT